MSFRSEFKDFVSRGNMIDLAVGVVIGAAFGKIIASLVDDILMPPIGMALGGVNFTDLKLVLKSGSIDAAGAVVNPVTLNYGNFIQAAITFLIVALAIFTFVVKPMNILKRKQVEVPPAPAALSKEEILLTEIRDLLRK
jgi:large conductance mechanosensitive channel